MTFVLLVEIKAAGSKTMFDIILIKIPSGNVYPF